MLVLALLLPACGPDTGAQDPGTGATSGGSSDASTDAAATISGPTTTAATMATMTATSSPDTGETVPCDGVPCGPSAICLSIFEGDFSYQTCVPNPDDCIPTPTCSPACQALCDAYSAGICPEQNPEAPHDLACPEFIYCNTFDPESGCPEGQKCYPPDFCAQLDPDPIPVGEPCLKRGLDPCVAGAYCAFGSDRPGGTCRPFCTGSAAEPLCPEASGCAMVGDFDAFVCLPSCDPLAPNCPGTDLCVHSNGEDQFVCAPNVSGDTGALYSPCQDAHSCDPGLYCSSTNMVGTCDPDREGCCLPYCDLDAPMCPDMALECAPWYPMGQAPPGLEDLGACTLPP